VRQVQVQRDVASLGQLLLTLSGQRSRSRSSVRSFLCILVCPCTSHCSPSCFAPHTRGPSSGMHTPSAALSGVGRSPPRCLTPVVSGERASHGHPASARSGGLTAARVGGRLTPPVCPELHRTHTGALGSVGQLQVFSQAPVPVFSQPPVSRAFQPRGAVGQVAQVHAALLQLLAACHADRGTAVKRVNWV